MTQQSSGAVSPAHDLGNRNRKKWTRAEVRRLYELGALTPNDRLELLNGELVEIMGMNGPHATAVVLLQGALLQIFGTGYVARFQLPFVVADESEPEPDAAIVIGNPRDFVQEHPSQAVLIVEVSDSTLSYDLNGKAALYAQAGVADYWVLDINSRLLYVYRNPVSSPVLPGGFGYQTISRLTETDQISPLSAPHHSFGIAEILP